MIERRTAVAGPLAAAIGAIAIGAKALIGAVMARRAVAAEAAGGVAEAVCGRSCGRARTGRPRVRTWARRRDGAELGLAGMGSVSE